MCYCCRRAGHISHSMVVATPVANGIAVKLTSAVGALVVWSSESCAISVPSTSSAVAVSIWFLVSKTWCDEAGSSAVHGASGAVTI